MPCAKAQSKEKLKNAFSNIVSEVRPKVEVSPIKDFNWLRGFVEGEGSFQVIVQKANHNCNRSEISLRFTITQHIRDRVLLESFVDYLGCGRFYEPLARSEIYFITTAFLDINEKIIPFFKPDPLLGVKRADYLDFLKRAELIKSKKHLTKEGLEEINLIKSNMNSKRILLENDEIS